METEERRQHKRFDLTLEVEAGFGQQTFPGRIVALSLGGCLVATTLNVTLRDQIHLGLYGTDSSHLRVKGEIRSIVAGVGLGIKFLDLSQEDLERIRSIIYKKSLDESRTSALSWKRQEPRVTLGVPVRIWGTNIFDEPFEEVTVTVNVSHGGACFFTRHFLGVGTTVHLEAYGTFKAISAVRFLWLSEKDTERFAVGVQFLETEGKWVVK